MNLNKEQINSKINKRAKERFLRKTSYISVKYLRKAQEMNFVPKAMNPFFKALQDVYIKNLNIYEGLDKRIVSTYCAMIPDELIYAAGGIPLRICSGSYAARQMGEEIMSKDICPLVKAAVGSIMSNGIGCLSNCSYSVIPVTCDCKRKLVDRISKYHDTLSVRIPSSSQDDNSICEYIKELYKLKSFLECRFSTKITYQKLYEAIKTTYEVSFTMKRFFEIKSKIPSVIYGTHFMIIMNAYTYMDIYEWIKCVKNLNVELEKRILKVKGIARKNTPRIMLIGSPMIFPNIKIPYIIENTGGLVVADETCMGEQFYIDVPVINDYSMDGLMRALAVRSIRPCTCPIFVDTDKRKYRIKQLIQKNNVDGVIYHVLRGCLVYDYEYKQIEQMLEQMGVKVLRIETDYSEEDVEQLKIRIEAFLEVIKFSKI